MGESDKEDDKITCLVGRDRWSVMTFAYVVKGKGPQNNWIVDARYEDLQSLGYPEIRIRSDNEPDVDPAVEGQPQTNGVAEKGVQDGTTQCRK